MPLQIVGGVRREHRRARERDRDAGAELDALGVLGGDHERQERVASRLRGEQAVVADVFQLACPDRDVFERARHDPGVDLHGPDPTLPERGPHPSFSLHLHAKSALKCNLNAVDTRRGSRLRPLRLDDEAAFVAGHKALASDGWPPKASRSALGFRAGNAVGRSTWISATLASVQASRSPTNFVASTFLVADVDGQIVGRASIRHSITNEFLAREGGHIGYAC